MTVTEIITAILSYTDNVTASGAENAVRRSRTLEALREVLEELWYARDWTFSRKLSTVTMTVAHLTYGALPTDFLRFGEYGGVYLPTAQGGRKLTGPLPEYEIRLLQQLGLPEDPPSRFSVFGTAERIASDAIAGYDRLLQIPPISAQIVLSVDYHTVPPLIDEGSNVLAIERVPAQYHRSVLIPGVRAKVREAQGDARYQNDRALYEGGVADMKAQENRSQGRLMQLPSFFGE